MSQGAKGSPGSVAGHGRLAGKVAIVTGGARGQGEAEVRLFVEEGAQVVFGDVLDEEGELVAKDVGPNAHYLHLDVTSERDWAAAMAEAERRYGPVNVLVNNAGIIKVGLLDSQPIDEFKQILEVNLIGTLLGMRAVVPSMSAAGGGSIVNISSINGLIGGSGLGAYTSSKFAIRGLTKCAALEFSEHNIRVNSVHPGGVDTYMIRLPEFGEHTSQAFSKNPIPRAATPLELAKLVLFLASDDSSFSTGSEFVADGGTLAGIKF